MTKVRKVSFLKLFQFDKDLFKYVYKPKAVWEERKIEIGWK